MFRIFFGFPDTLFGSSGLPGFERFVRGRQHGGFFGDRADHFTRVLQDKRNFGVLETRFRQRAWGHPSPSANP